MSNYLGQSPTFGDFPFQILTGNGGSSYTLTYKVSGENGMLVFLNGAVQRPGIDYTAKGSILTFSSAVPSGVQIFTYGMGLPKSTLAPSDGASLATPTQFDDSQKIATTEFVQRALGNYASATIAQVTASRTMLASEAGSVTWLGNSGGGSHTITLPPIASVLRGASFTFIATGTTSTYTVVGSGAELTVTYSGAGQSAGFTSNQIVLRGGESVEVVSNGAYWLVKSGQMQHMDVFKASLTATGYQKLPSGLIIQWGSHPAGSVLAQSYPIAFPNAVFIVIGAATTVSDGDLETASYDQYTVTGFRANGDAGRWLAIGY